MAEDAPVENAQWEGVQRLIKKVGHQDFDPPACRVVSAVKALEERSRTWCYAYVKSGGDVFFAAQRAGYKASPTNLATRLLARDAVRRFIVLVFESVQRKHEAAYMAERKAKKEAQKPPGAEIASPTASEPKTAEIVVSDEPREFRQATDEISKILGHAWDTLNFRAGDLIQLETGPTGRPTGMWKVDVEAVKKLPPGVLRGFKRGEFGEMQVSLADPAQARDFLMQFYKGKSGTEDTARQTDVRAVIFNLIQSKDGDWSQLEGLARDLGKQLAATKKRTHGAVKIVKEVAAQPLDAEDPQV